MRDTNTYVDLVIAACSKIGDFTSGMTLEQFLVDSRTQSAIIMQLQVIGETAKKIPEVTRSEVAVPWKMIIGLRDIISHDYFSLDLSSVWSIAHTSVPELDSALRAYLSAQGTTYIPPNEGNIDVLAALE
jgi:uncharacterized protein with HEPN domain